MTGVDDMMVHTGVCAFGYSGEMMRVGVRGGLCLFTRDATCAIAGGYDGA